MGFGNGIYNYKTKTNASQCFSDAISVVKFVKAGISKPTHQLGFVVFRGVLKEVLCLVFMFSILFRETLKFHLHNKKIPDQAIRDFLLKVFII